MKRVLSGIILCGVILGGLVAWRFGRVGASAPPVGKAGPSAAWFEDRAAAAGVAWRLQRAPKKALTILEVMGTGCAVLDFDDDGWDDLFLVGQTGFGHRGRCALYRNQGNGSFHDVTAGSGLETLGYSMGCATGDIDNDGRVDLFVSGYGINQLFRNRGGGRFEDVTRIYGVAATSATEFNSAVAFGDYDLDGWLDLYAGRYVLFTPASRQHCLFAGIDGACPPWAYEPQAGFLYRNLKGRRLEDVTREAGLTNQHGKTLGALWTDFNEDGRPDLYLANDGVAGDLYQSTGGRFRNVGSLTGTAYNQMGSTQAGMGTDAADYDGDGRLDLVVTTFRQEPTSLYANRGGGLFDHTSLATGLDLPSRTWTGFGTRLADFNNDGWPDLAVANGHVLEKEKLVDKFSSYEQPMQFFLNESGARFADRSAEAGPGFTTPAVGRGLATGDFNRDGRLDLVVTDLEGPVRLLINRIPSQNAWIGFRLRGTRSNRMALGARITLEAGGRKQVGECRTSGSYFSASSPVVHFGVGAADGSARATIHWPGGGTTHLRDLSLNQYHSVEEPAE